MKKGRYSNFLGLQCERDEKELLEEKEQYKQLAEIVNKEKKKRIDQSEFINSQISSIDYALNEHKRKRLLKIEVTDEHKKLLSNMDFKGMWYGDTVSIGADGKRPFGNSSVYSDVARILGWELPNDDLSNEQVKRAEELLDELPYALNKIIQSTPKLKNKE